MAIQELGMYDLNTHWDSIFKPIKAISHHTGFLGVLHDNNVFEIDLPEWDNEEPNKQLRFERGDHPGFTSCLYTQTSMDAMKYRELCSGCRIRVCTRNTLMQAHEYVTYVLCLKHLRVCNA